MADTEPMAAKTRNLLVVEVDAVCEPHAILQPAEPFECQFRLAARADFPLDRLADAVLVSDAISAHADEDMTHSRLFMRDLRTLGWDEMLGWRPSELYYWLFLSEVNEQLRRRTTQITKLVIEAEDPLVRFAVVESIETCGNALFRHTTKLANEYTARTGKELIYWGEFHLARETGHAVDDDAFEQAELTPAQREAARRRAIRIFELIDEQNSDMLRLAQETISQGGFEYRRAIHAAPPKWLPTIPGCVAPRC